MYWTTWSRGDIHAIIGGYADFNHSEGDDGPYAWEIYQFRLKLRELLPRWSPKRSQWNSLGWKAKCCGAGRWRACLIFWRKPTCESVSPRVANREILDRDTLQKSW